MQSASKIRLGLGQSEVSVGRVRVGRETPQTSSNTWQTPCLCWMTLTLLSTLCLIRSIDLSLSLELCNVKLLVVILVQTEDIIGRFMCTETTWSCLLWRRER